MNEEQWLDSTDPREMLEHLRTGGMLTDRKLRLFLVACCRRIWHLLKDDRCREAVGVAEQFAEGLATEEERSSAEDVVVHASRAINEANGDVLLWPKSDLAALASCSACGIVTGPPAELAGVIPVIGNMKMGSASVGAGSAGGAVYFATLDLSQDKATADTKRAEEHAAQCQLLRCVYGNLFRPQPPLGPAWLRQHDVVVRLAQAAYDGRVLPAGTLDPDRLAVLSDALEEAGADAGLVEHLRGPGPHVRGCFGLDLLLGRS
jgi:hypothetical protein